MDIQHSKLEDIVVRAGQEERPRQRSESPRHRTVGWPGRFFTAEPPLPKKTKYMQELATIGFQRQPTSARRTDALDICTRRYVR
jgi:hypothetical protein